ncbi:AAA family ATPase [Rhizobium sp. CNPSo 4039]|uniref:ATP-dependent nuclease n=1 Tax=Rhizobium sp. CNPSo 4039 TaxID=3021409 RepID=UPI00254CB230|nr:AAA family ATPase [Rhizobium sp. CNPSo 4039]MDK4711573.1 AAA family ATPase [Rhizobium sp. CNPSo 4039]
MLNSISFKFGSAVGQEPLELPTPPSVTIFVGPNNSGKSQALNEIRAAFARGSCSGNILKDASFIGFDAEGALALLTELRDTLRPGEIEQQDYAYIKTRSTGGRQHVHTSIYLAALQAPQVAHQRHLMQQFAELYATHQILSLDGPSRITLISQQPRGDLKYPELPFARLLTDDMRRERLRKIIYESTGLYFALDASAGDQLQVRFSEAQPPNERSLEDATLDYMRAAAGVDRVSDGIKAFTGILVQLHAGDHKVITIDEPEAFLHPGLAFKLGKELARGAVEEGKLIFASTHSAQFLMGAISSGALVNIVRLTYTGGIATARLLSNNQLRILMQDPLLRSVGVLDGLFYSHVIVGEANADRAFYQEVNERLLAQGDARGIPHALFLNADNKQTIPRIVEPLRKLGLPAASVTDLDVLKDGGEEWTRQLKASGLPSAEFQAYQNRRASVLSFLQNTNKNFKTEGGVGLLTGSELETASNLIEDLARYGLFVVPGGEVENWLSDLDIGRAKHTWLRDIFSKMGSDPTAATYVRPGAGDVWDFVGNIGIWLMAKNRRGIPL